MPQRPRKPNIRRLERTVFNILGIQDRVKRAQAIKSFLESKTAEQQHFIISRLSRIIDEVKQTAGDFGLSIERRQKIIPKKQADLRALKRKVRRLRAKRPLTPIEKARIARRALKDVETAIYITGQTIKFHQQLIPLLPKKEQVETRQQLKSLIDQQAGLMMDAERLYNVIERNKGA